LFGTHAFMAADDRFPGWVRYSSIGLELAGATAGLALVGYWIDGRFGTAPWGILGGVAIGIVGGLYNLVRESLAAVRSAATDDARAAEDAGESKDDGPRTPVA
jgi:F0F1-type ATP synthase assembly protein I